MRILFLACFTLLASCTNNQKVIKNQSVGPALGTSYSIIYLDEKELDFQSEIDSVFHVVNQSMSTYWPDSDISKINRGDSLIKVDHMFKESPRFIKESPRFILEISESGQYVDMD